jgi:sugar phosphate isomerase/epimerase
MERMTNALYLAEEVGACCAVDIFGSYVHGKGDAKFTAENFSDDAFADAVDIARQLIDTVKPKTAYFTYEIFPFNIVDSPEMIEKLIRAVDREKFGVHLDLCNLINGPRAYFSSGDIMRDCVKRFGDKIVAAHVKDIKLKEPAVSVILEEVMPGEGGIDMRAFIREIHKLPQQVPFLMEHLSSEAEYDKAAEYIRRCAREENIII